jgi:monothiol glutaredoxin
MDVQKIIHDQVTSNPGRSVHEGFPGHAPLRLLCQCHADPACLWCDVKFVAVDVLADEAIRQGIKEYASWPTIPQLYIKGEFVGGSDIMREMYESGELKKLLDGVA